MTSDASNSLVFASFRQSILINGSNLRDSLCFPSNKACRSVSDGEA